eukprot:gene1190-10704_t
MSLSVKNLSHINCINSPKVNRYGHTMNLYSEQDKKDIFIFGGLLMNMKDIKETKSLMYELEFTNQLLQFSLSDNMWKEHSLNSKGTLPKGRHFHSSIIYQKSLFIFGGKSNGYLNDVQEYSIENNTWSELNTDGDIPTPRYGHSAVCYDNCMYVFGGYDSESFSCNDIFELNLGISKKSILNPSETLKWKKIELKQSPPVRFHHKCILETDTMIIFGGIHQGIKHLNDLWIYNFKDNEWIELQTTGKKPKERYGHQIFLVNDNLFVYGGTEKDSEIKSIDYINFKDLKWKSLNLSEFPFENISGTVFTTIIQHDNVIYFYGGIFKKKNNYSDETNVVIDLLGQKFDQKTTKNFNDLPEDTILKILSYLNKTSICNISMVSKRWIFSKYSNHNFIWKNDYDYFFETFKDTGVFDTLKFDPKSDYSYKNLIIQLYHQNVQMMSHYKPQNENHRYIGSQTLKICTKNIIHQPIKLIVLGNGAVGKTCLLISYATNSNTVCPCPTVPIVLVGTKSDLRNHKESIDRVNDGKMCFHSKDDGIAMAKKYGCVAYCETSALTQDGLKDCFDCCITAACFQKNYKKSTKHQNCILS